MGVIHLPQLFWVNLYSPAKTAGVVAFPLGKNCQRRNCPLSGGEKKALSQALNRGWKNRVNKFTCHGKPRIELEPAKWDPVVSMM